MELRTEILWYAGIAGASDGIPVPAVGMVSVPAIQAKMLHSLANQFGVEWSNRLVAEMMGALGAGFGVGYLSQLGAKQVTKLIPFYGQTVGAVVAASLSFGTTYAIGRVACKYLYHKKRGECVSKDEMRALYETALRNGKLALGDE